VKNKIELEVTNNTNKEVYVKMTSDDDIMEFVSSDENEVFNAVAVWFTYLYGGEITIEL